MKRTNDFSSSDQNKKVRYSQPLQQTPVQQSFNYANGNGNMASGSAMNPGMGQMGMNQGMGNMMPFSQDMFGYQNNPQMQYMGQYQQGNPMGMYGAMGLMGQYGNPQFNFGVQVENANMRTVYIGQLPPAATAEDICNLIKTGMLEHIKLLEEKNCAFVSFIDPVAANAFVAESMTRSMSIHSVAIRVGFGNKFVPVPSDVLAAVSVGASRNVFVGNVDEGIDENYLREEFGKFGPIESIKILRDKGYAFIHMCSIATAVKAVSSLPSESAWEGKKLGYGKDRCAVQKPGQTPQSNGMQGGMQMGMGPAMQPGMNMMGGMGYQYPMGGGFMDANQNRTIYLGNLAAEVTLKDICDSVRGGILEKVKLSADKRYAFVTFIDPNAATALYNRGNSPTEGVVIKGKRARVNFGKASFLPVHIQAAIMTNGATRNVYIGNINTDIFTAQKLNNDFQMYGEIELVNVVPEKNAGFVNFTDIASAIKAVEDKREDEEYKIYKVNFGKDRCGGPPRQRPNNGNQPSMDETTASAAAYGNGGY
ncbi:hypothetical protein HK098_003982 [Nowakowskiella sp. JEL0407]|nr:hypothetical protein HK098_003982 [Nowakowskiella sp. JEL0407]